MLELKNIKKEYRTDSLVQTALDNVTINFRKCEFASVLGPSGSGKTTLLNIIGGLDHYDSGDLVINEVSTKKYKSSNWDSYRNHRVGFVFQSYNLITHQSILQNVELALTLSGVSKKERKKRALKVLKDVGLEKHVHKRPNQLSGGQMQRVAIARALVNNPDILLADEPTGALDSETSKQIMELLKKVAKDKLVIMVTHNPDLAKEYSSRIIQLKDGHIVDDTNPYDGKEVTSEDKKTVSKKSKKTSMGLLTALSLSLNNLMTKKGRTILTAFAGSIGIIGIALILSLSSGVRQYIDRTEKETLSDYPLTIEANAIDMSQMIITDTSEEIKCQDNKICTTDDITNNPSVIMSSNAITNNLRDFKKALDNNYKDINKYVTDIGYNYDLDLQIYSLKDDHITKVNPNTLSLTGDEENNYNFMAGYNNVFKEMIDNKDLINSQYQILKGKMPSKYNEIVLVVDENYQINASVMYALDIENREELKEYINKAKDDKTKLDTKNYDYDSLIGRKYKLVLNTDYYKKENGVWINHMEDEDYLKQIVSDGIDLEITGIIKIDDDATSAQSGYIGYTHELSDYVIDKINDQDIVKDQLNNKEINVFTNKKFDNLTSTYEQNLNILGVKNLDEPAMINIYPKNYEAKDEIKTIIDDYNSEQKEENKIIYNDYVGILMSSITTVINVITYVLIAFVAISLVVSSIMIAIITYISVLERTKEIGILRAIGASKKDITRVFNAETIIEGLVAGIFGVVITTLLNIPINIILNSIFEVNHISKLPYNAAIILIIISVVLNVIAGLFPAKMASKKDPVKALRTE